MVARTKQKQRGQAKRARKRMILIGCEGKNQTEQNYFKEFNQTQKTIPFSLQVGTVQIRKEL